MVRIQSFGNRCKSASARHPGGNPAPGTPARPLPSLASKWSLCGLAAAGLLLAANPAQADFCYQLTGGAFSGDLGFFRFKGKLPTASGQVVALKGRVAGLGPVFGTAVVAKDGSYLEIGATFFVDAEQGQIDMAFFPPTKRTGGGDGDYGAYGLGGGGFVAKRKACSNEP